MQRHRFWTAVGLLILALAIRGAVLLLERDRLTADPDGYRLLAQNLTEHGTFGRDGQPTAYRPPLYPLLLAVCEAGPWNALTAIAVLHLALGVATAALTLEIARRWPLGDYSFLAAGLVACDPILLHQSSLVMTETLAAFLSIVSFAAVSAASGANGCRRVVLSALAGASFGLAALCRPTFLAALVFTTLALVWRTREPRMRVACGIAMLAAGAAVVSPWAVRNAMQFRQPIVTTTHGGYTLLLGNNADYYEFLRTQPWRAVWRADRLDAGLLASRAGDEISEDRREYALAWQAIHKQPGMFAYAALRRVGALWGALPHARSEPESTAMRTLRYATAAWYSIVLLLALMAALCRQVRAEAPAWLFAAAMAGSFTAVHFFYWTDLRMRAPLMPVVCLLAAAGARRLRIPRTKN